MKVKMMTASVAKPGEDAAPRGAVRDLAEAEAKRLIASGLAAPLSGLDEEDAVDEKEVERQTVLDVMRDVAKSGKTVKSGAPDLEAVNAALEGAGVDFRFSSADERDAVWASASA